MLGAEDAGDAEQIGIEAKGGEEVSSVVGEADGFREGGRWMRGLGGAAKRGWGWRRGE